jgi:hypothetical protein
MNYKQWYKAHYEARLHGRYITLEHLMPLLKLDHECIKISCAGYSVMKQEIPLVRIGKGQKVVLGWSQMHGNESTTTKAIFDFIKFIGQKDLYQSEIKQFLETYSFYILPILNPDGAVLYTRANANKIDLNRDAQKLSQRESVVLRTIFDRVKPDLCLNLHDQRSIYGLKNGMSATVSFLAPSANKDRTLSPSRLKAMQHIARLDRMLQNMVPGQIGRYDDSFNSNCVGDTFQMAGVPTILFEAGHSKQDYHREDTRLLIFHSFLELFKFTQTEENSEDFNSYFTIPENQLNFNDIILRNVSVKGYQDVIDIAIQYSEVLTNGSIQFNAVIDTIGNCDLKFGHSEMDLFGGSVLINSQENMAVGQNVWRLEKISSGSLINLLKK